MMPLILLAMAGELIEHGFYGFGLAAIFIGVCSTRWLVALAAGFCIGRSLRR